MTRSVIASVSMPSEMADDIDEHRKQHGMEFSEYIRHCVRQANDSPFDTPDEVLCRDENYENGRRNEGAA